MKFVVEPLGMPSKAADGSTATNAISAYFSNTNVNDIPDGKITIPTYVSYNNSEPVRYNAYMINRSVFLVMDD